VHRKTHFRDDNLSFRFQATAAGSTGLKCLVHSVGLWVLKTTEERSTVPPSVTMLVSNAFSLTCGKIGKASIG
jgi:hypothetical protein